MTQTDLEERLEKLDQRRSRIEQVLPTLATKVDLEQFESRQGWFTERVLDRVNVLADAFSRLSHLVTSLETETRGVKHMLDTLACASSDERDLTDWRLRLSFNVRPRSLQFLRPEGCL